jgi:hypothetical protein
MDRLAARMVQTARRCPERRRDLLSLLRTEGTFMRNMLAFLAMIALAVGGTGWYLGWFEVKSAPGSAGHRDYNIDINTVKLGDDLHKGASKVEKLLEKNAPAAAATVKHDGFLDEVDGKAGKQDSKRNAADPAGPLFQ